MFAPNLLHFSCFTLLIVSHGHCFPSQCILSSSNTNLRSSLKSSLEFWIKSFLVVSLKAFCNRSQKESTSQSLLNVFLFGMHEILRHIELQSFWLTHSFYGRQSIERNVSSIVCLFLKYQERNLHLIFLYLVLRPHGSKG